MNNTSSVTTSNNTSSMNYGTNWLWMDPWTTSTPLSYTTWLSDLWVNQAKETGTFPPYNITRTEDSTKWKLTMALAGYAPDDIDITVEQNQLTIKGDVNKMVDDKYSTSVHKGIAERAFTRIFTLGEHVEVKSVFFKNGMLDLELELVLPESKKPRKLTIATK